MTEAIPDDACSFWHRQQIRGKAIGALDRAQVLEDARDPACGRCSVCIESDVVVMCVCGHENVRSHDDGVGPCRGYTQMFAGSVPSGFSITGCPCNSFEAKTKLAEFIRDFFGVEP